MACERLSVSEVSRRSQTSLKRSQDRRMAQKRRRASLHTTALLLLTLVVGALLIPHLVIGFLNLVGLN